MSDETVPIDQAPWLPDQLEDDQVRGGPDKVTEPRQVDPARPTTRPLGEQHDRRAFSLAPVYQGLGVDFSLSHQFASELPYSQGREFLSDLQTVQLLHPLLDLPEDGQVLQTLTDHWFDLLHTWLTTMTFGRTLPDGSRQISGVKGQDLRVYDLSSTLISHDRMIAVRVYTPSVFQGPGHVYQARVTAEGTRIAIQRKPLRQSRQGDPIEA